MRSKRELTVPKFERRHPTLKVADYIDLDSGAQGYAALKREGLHTTVACRTGRNLGKVLYELSEACYLLAGLDAMDRQGWKDSNTGQIGVGLDRHHLKHRSAGRLDSEANLVGVSRATHNAQHGQPQWSKKQKSL